MAGHVLAKLFKHGGSQAVRLPKAFRFEGEQVKLTRVGRGVLIEPEEFDFDTWFKQLDELRDGSFMIEGRPPQGAPEERDSFD
jgi:antitoxin VapB